MNNSLRDGSFYNVDCGVNLSLSGLFYFFDFIYLAVSVLLFVAGAWWQGSGYGVLLALLSVPLPIHWGKIISIFHREFQYDSDFCQNLIFSTILFVKFVCGSYILHKDGEANIMVPYFIISALFASVRYNVGSTMPPKDSFTACQPRSLGNVVFRVFEVIFCFLGVFMVAADGSSGNLGEITLLLAGYLVLVLICDRTFARIYDRFSLRCVVLMELSKQINAEAKLVEMYISCQIPSELLHSILKQKRKDALKPKDTAEKELVNSDPRGNTDTLKPNLCKFTSIRGATGRKIVGGKLQTAGNEFPWVTLPDVNVSPGEDHSQDTYGGASYRSVGSEGLLTDAAALGLLPIYSKPLLSAEEIQNLTGSDKRFCAVIAIKRCSTTHTSLFHTLAWHALLNAMDEVAGQHFGTCIRKCGDAWIGTLGFFQSHGNARFDCYHAMAICCDIVHLCNLHNTKVCCAVDYGSITCGFLGKVGQLTVDCVGPEIRFVLAMAELGAPETIFVSSSAKTYTDALMKDKTPSFLHDRLPDIFFHKAEVPVPSELSPTLIIFAISDTRDWIPCMQPIPEVSNLISVAKGSHAINSSSVVSLMESRKLFMEQMSGVHLQGGTVQTSRCDILCTDNEINNLVAAMASPMSKEEDNHPSELHINVIAMNQGETKRRGMDGSLNNGHILDLHNLVLTHLWKHDTFVGLLLMTGLPTIDNNETVLRSGSTDGSTMELFLSFFTNSVINRSESNIFSTVGLAANKYYGVVNEKLGVKKGNNIVTTISEAGAYFSKAYEVGYSEFWLTSGWSSSGGEGHGHGHGTISWSSYSSKLCSFSLSDSIRRCFFGFFSLIVAIELLYISVWSVYGWRFMFVLLYFFRLLFYDSHSASNIWVYTTSFISRNVVIASVLMSNTSGLTSSRIGCDTCAVLLILLLLWFPIAVEQSLLFTVYDLLSCWVVLVAYYLLVPNFYINLFVILCFFIICIQLFAVIWLLRYFAFVCHVVECHLLPGALFCYTKQRDTTDDIMKPTATKSVGAWHNSNPLTLPGMELGIAPRADISDQILCPMRLQHCTVLAVHVKCMDMLPGLICCQDLALFSQAIFSMLENCMTECGLIVAPSFAGVAMGVSYDKDESNAYSPNCSVNKTMAAIRIIQNRMNVYNVDHSVNVTLGIGMSRGSCVVGRGIGNARFHVDVCSIIRDEAFVIATNEVDGVIKATTPVIREMLPYSGSSRALSRATLADASITIINPNVQSSILTRGSHTIDCKQIRFGAGPLTGVCLADFSYVRMIGRGGYGSVHLLKEKASGQEVAFKVIPLRGTTRSKLFKREFLILRKLCHPNVIKFYYSMRSKNVNYLVMMYLPGGNLSEIVKQQVGPMSIFVLMSWFAELVLALEYIHENGIIHRDIKPTNCIIGSDGHLRLADFGLAKIVSDPASNVKDAFHSNNTSDKMSLVPSDDGILTGLTEMGNKIMQTAFPMKQYSPTATPLVGGGRCNSTEVFTLHVVLLELGCPRLPGCGISETETMLRSMYLGQVSRFETIDAALNCSSVHPFDVIVVDVTLMLGKAVSSNSSSNQFGDVGLEDDEMYRLSFSVLESVMEHASSWGNLPILVLSPYDNTTWLKHCKSVGAKDIMIKPLMAQHRKTIVKHGNSTHLFREEVSVDTESKQVMEKQSVVSFDLGDVEAGPPARTADVDLASTTGGNRTKAVTAMLGFQKAANPSKEWVPTDSSTSDTLATAEPVKPYVPPVPLDTRDKDAKAPGRHSIVGTLNFISPEVLQQRSYCETSIDWWACGVTFYECVVREKLFQGSNREAVIKQILHPDYIASIIWSRLVGYSHNLASLVASMLHHDPKERLGMSEIASIKAIKADSFFSRVDWATISTCNCAFRPRRLLFPDRSSKQKEAEEALFYGTPLREGTIGHVYQYKATTRKKRSHKTSTIIREFQVTSKIRNISINCASEDDSKRIYSSRNAMNLETINENDASDHSEGYAEETSNVADMKDILSSHDDDDSDCSWSSFG